MGNFYSQSNTSPSFVSKSEYDTYVSTTSRVLDLNTVLADPTLTQKLLTALASDSRFIGPQGIQGQVGLQGVKGDTGPQGIQGVKGDTGPQGLQGAKGDTGPQGLQGATGDTGPTGLQGAKWDTWPQGLQGPSGTTQDLSIYTKLSQLNNLNPTIFSINSNTSYPDGGGVQRTPNLSFFSNSVTGRDFVIANVTDGISGGDISINPRWGGNVKIGYDPYGLNVGPGYSKDTNVPSSRLAVQGDINASENLIGNGIKIGTNNSKICRASLTFNAYNGGTTNSNLTTLSSNGLSISRVNTAIFQINFTGDKPSDTNYIVTSFGIYNQPPMSGANMYGSYYNKTTNGFNLLISTRNTDNTEMKSDGTGFMDVCVFW